MCFSSGIIEFEYAQKLYNLFQFVYYGKKTNKYDEWFQSLVRQIKQGDQLAFKENKRKISYLMKIILQAYLNNEPFLKINLHYFKIYLNWVKIVHPIFQTKFKKKICLNPKWFLHYCFPKKNIEKYFPISQSKSRNALIRNIFHELGQLIKRHRVDNKKKYFYILAKLDQIPMNLRCSHKP